MIGEDGRGDERANTREGIEEGAKGKLVQSHDAMIRLHRSADLSLKDNAAPN